jgi:hypothetical protein
MHLQNFSVRVRHSGIKMGGGGGDKAEMRNVIYWKIRDKI